MRSIVKKIKFIFFLCSITILLSNNSLYAQNDDTGTTTNNPVTTNDDDPNTNDDDPNTDSNSGTTANNPGITGVGGDGILEVPGCGSVDRKGASFAVSAFILCCVLKALTGKIGGAIATFAVLFAGFGAATGKFAWQQTFIVAFIVFGIFSAEKIMEAIASMAGVPYVGCP